MSDIFPVVLGICLDAEAIRVGRAPENLKRQAAALDSCAVTWTADA